MHIFIRVDSSVEIGYGHVMRCLTLSEELKKQGAKVTFITRNHKGNLNNLIISKKFNLEVISNKNFFYDSLSFYDRWLTTTEDVDAKETIKKIAHNQIDWLIVDHYSLGVTWENKIRNFVSKIMVIDDLANRKHNCDLLFDQTYNRKKSDYINLVSKKTKLILGSKNALLRSDFSKLKHLSVKYRNEYKSINSILISAGSVDNENLTSKVLNALKAIKWKKNPVINVVLSSAAPYLDYVKKLSKECKFQVNVLVDISNMAELMLRSDLAIGSGGTTSWERCCMGLPTILIVLADNQKKIGESLFQAGAVITLQEDYEIENSISQSIVELMKDKKKYIRMSHNASKICDGYGAKRTVEKIYYMTSGKVHAV